MFNLTSESELESVPSELHSVVIGRWWYFIIKICRLNTDMHNNSTFLHIQITSSDSLPFSSPACLNSHSKYKI